MRAKRILATGIAVLVTASASHAATIAEITGTVLASTGQGFVAAQQSQTVNPGARVMVRANSLAKVSYSDFCVVIVKPGQTYTVAQNSPCATGAATVPGNALPHDYALIGGAVLVGAGAAVYFATRPASP